MIERCPLGQSASVWAADIPEICQRQCEAVWERMSTEQVPEVDSFTENCDEQGEVACEHDIEFEDAMLQKLGYAKRGYTILNVCAATGTELFSDSYSFECPNDLLSN